MRIAFLTTEFVTEPNFAGGLAQYLGRVVPGLVQRGHEVEVFVTSTQAGRTTCDGAMVHRVVERRLRSLRMVNLIVKTLNRRPLARVQQACAYANGLNLALHARSRQASFDVVQASSWMATGFFAVRNPVAPVVVRISSYAPLWEPIDERYQTPDQRLWRRMEAYAIRKARAVYAPSRFLAEHVRSAIGTEVTVVRPPFPALQGHDVDTSAVQQLRNEGWDSYLLFFGRVDRRKGSGILARAISPLLRTIPTMRLAIAGPVDSTDSEAQSLLALESDYSGQVRYMGVLKPPRLRPLISAARAVVLPTLMDNLPNACLEAMALEQVVIGPDGASFDEMIENGESGFLFRLGEEGALRDIITRVWQLPESRLKSVGRAARSVIDGLAPGIRIADLEVLFERVVGGDAKPTRSLDAKMLHTQLPD